MACRDRGGPLRCPVRCAPYGSVIAVRPQASSLRCARRLIRCFAPPSPVGRRNAERVRISIGALQPKQQIALQASRRLAPSAARPNVATSRLAARSARTALGRAALGPTYFGSRERSDRAIASVALRTLSAHWRTTAANEASGLIAQQTHDLRSNPGPGPRAQRSGARRRARQCRANAPPHPKSRL